MNAQPRTPDAPHRLRIALAHDWLCGIRGGEHVLERIAGVIEREHQPGGIYVMFDDGGPIGPAVSRLRTHASWLNRLPGAARLRRWLLPLYPAAVADLSRQLAQHHGQSPIDLVISSSSAAIKGLKPPPGVPHLCYCHSPARYVWGQKDEYRGGLRGVGLSLFADRFRRWDQTTAANVTAFLANSSHTAAQIQACYGRGSTVIHPPVRDGFFTGDCPARDPGLPWLVVSALEPYKRVDLAIAAARLSNHPLIVVGGGSLGARLRAANADAHHIRFLGRIADDELRRVYHQCSVLIFPQVEDFGIVPLEAMACGLPVVACGQGGALETVVPGETGIFFYEGQSRDILAAVAACPRGGDACRRRASLFSQQHFDAAIAAAIAGAVASQKTPPKY